MKALPLLTLIPRPVSYTIQFTLFGAVFGLMFPVAGTILEVFLQGLPLGWASLREVQRSQPLLWIIDSAPLVLGWVFSLAGRRQDILSGEVLSAREANVRLEERLLDLSEEARPRSEVTEELIRGAIGEAEARLGDLLDSTPSCLKLVGRNGGLLFMNRRGLDLIEAPDLPSVFQANVYDIVEASHRDEFIKFHERICDGESGSLVFEIVGLNGTRRWMETFAAPHEVQGEVVQLALTNDITDRVRKLQESEVQRRELQQAQKLATVGEFAAGLGHEINNPLAIISGSAGLLLMEIEEGLPDPDWAREELQKIENTALRVRSIADGLKTLARRDDEGGRAMVQVTRMLGALELLSQPLLAKHDIRLDIAVPEEFEVFTNAVQVEQVLMNLVSNSLHAVRDLPDPWIAIRAASADSGMVRISVSDAGHLTDSSVIERMNEPFFTTKEVGEGTGLGLSVSRALMEGLGGSLKFDLKAPNTTFHVYVPRSA